MTARFSLQHQRQSNIIESRQVFRKAIADAVRFARKYPGWSTFDHDPLTINAVLNAARRGRIVLNEHRRFRIR